MKSILKLAIAALMLALVFLGALYYVFFRPVSLTERELEALAAVMRADTIGEDIKVRALAQDWVADVHLRLRANLASQTKKKGSALEVSFLELMQHAVPLYPPGWKHGLLFTGRNITAIKRSSRYAGSPWILMLDRANQKLAQGVDPSRCAEKYIRVERRYEFATGEDEAAAELLKLVHGGKWKLDPKQPADLKMQFLCPVT